MTRALLVVALALPCVTAYAQRPAQPVVDLSDGALSSLVARQRSSLERCAAAEDTGAFVAEIRARVRPGRSPSTMYNARIDVSVRSRPRDGGFEACARRAIVDALRHTAYAVGPRGADARQTFRIADRPEPPPRRPPPPFREDEARRVLDAHRGHLQRCLEVAGVPERVTLRVAVEPDGRMALTNAELPPDASRHALPCLSRAVSRMRVAGRPARRVRLVHTLHVRSSAR